MGSLLVFAALCAVLVFAYKASIVLGIVCSVLEILFVWLFYGWKINLGRANAEFAKKNYDEAMKYYKKAYNSKNRKYEVDISYAQALLRTGNTEEAEKIVDNILSMRVTQDLKRAAKQTRCLIYSKTDRVDEAYEEAKELFYDEGYVTSNTYCLLGYLMLLKSDIPLKETTEHCEKAYDYDSDNRDNVDNLIVCCLREGDYKRAAELSDKLCEEHPQFVEAFYHGAAAYLKLGNRDKARELASKIKDCTRSFMTTVSEKEVGELCRELGAE